MSSFTDRVGVQPPGRALFIKDNQLSVFADGKLGRITTPYPVLDSIARLAPSGRAVALLGALDTGEVFLWSEGGKAMRVPAPYKTQDSAVIWAPSARRAVYTPSFDATEVFVIADDGSVYRTSLGTDLMHIADWRSDDELILLTAKPQTQFPITGVTYWSWRPPLDPVRIAGPVTLATYPKWSPDGSTLATVEEDAKGRAVHLRGSVDRVLIQEADLSSGPNGCFRGALRISALSWSDDSKTLALISLAGVAFTDTAGRTPSVLTVPTGAGSCYVAGRVDWSRGQAVVPLFGPACGAGDETNWLALVDPHTANASFIPISRKGFFASAGRWAAMAAPSTPGSTTFFSLDDPTLRTTVPTSPSIDYCCVP